MAIFKQSKLQKKTKPFGPLTRKLHDSKGIIAFSVSPDPLVSENDGIQTRTCTKLEYLGFFKTVVNSNKLKDAQRLQLSFLNKAGHFHLVICSIIQTVARNS